MLKYSDYEFSVPLSVIGLSAKDSLTLRGDVGLLLGDQRRYRGPCLLAQQIRQHDLGRAHRGAAHARAVGPVEVPSPVADHRFRLPADSVNRILGTAPEENETCLPVEGSILLD